MTEAPENIKGYLKSDEILEQMSKDELAQYIIDLRRHSMLNRNKEQAVKLMLNSIYGAFANQWFHFYNISIAETITLQGQDAIKLSEEYLEKYFRDYWHKDKELHEKLGIIGEVKPLKHTVWVYTDTDSGYIRFEECMKSCNWQGDEKEFVLQMNKHRLGEYFKKCFESYAKKHNTENYLDFELETIAKSAIWVAKKKYVQNVIWKDGKDYDNLKYIKTTGLEIIQSSTPIFCRGKLKDLLVWVFSQETIKIDKLIKVIRDIKQEFKLSNIEEISSNRSVGDYHKGILNDQSELQIGKGCPIHVRGAGYHNYLLNNSKHKGKYKLVTTGDKARYYYATDPFCDVFSYLPGEYPYEFAPQMDYEKQFEQFILQPLNRIIESCGINPLNRDLVYTTALFSSIIFIVNFAFNFLNTSNLVHTINIL